MNFFRFLSGRKVKSWKKEERRKKKRKMMKKKKKKKKMTTGHGMYLNPYPNGFKRNK